MISLFKSAERTVHELFSHHIEHIDPDLLYIACTYMQRRFKGIHKQVQESTSKMSMEGWWMVHTIVRPVLTMLRTALITMAAALASRPAPICQYVRYMAFKAKEEASVHLKSPATLQHVGIVWTSVDRHRAVQATLGLTQYKRLEHREFGYDFRIQDKKAEEGKCVPEVGSSMKMMEGLATSSTAMVSRLRCSTDSPLTPGTPTWMQVLGFKALGLGDAEAQPTKKFVDDMCPCLSGIDRLITVVEQNIVVAVWLGQQPLQPQT